MFSWHLIQFTTEDKPRVTVKKFLNGSLIEETTYANAIVQHGTESVDIVKAYNRSRGFIYSVPRVNTSIEWE